MRAAIIYGPRDIRMETVAYPSIKKDEILVKVRACGICGTDIHTYKVGKTSTSQSQQPIILGHEFSGEIVEVGQSVLGLKTGDKIVGTGYRACGKCHWCQTGQSDRCPNPTVPGEGLDGAFAEYVVVPNPALGKTIFHIPENLSWEEAATVEPLSVACFAVSRARIEPNQAVVILGAGMIGQCIAQVCKAMGTKVIVSEPSIIRLTMARKSGADVALNPRKTSPVEAVAEVTSGEMASVVFECSGAPAAFRQAPLLTRPFGRIIQVGMFEDTLELRPELLSLMFNFRNLTLRGSGGQRWDMAVELMQTGQVKTKELITHRLLLENIKEAFEAQINSDEAIKVIIEPGVT